MALADYFQRSAAAAAQTLSGFDEDAIRSLLDGVIVGVEIGDDADSYEGQSCAELAVRVLARLYPRLRIDGPGAGSLGELARAINPSIELVETDATVTLAIGAVNGNEGRTYFLGSSGWDALLSPKSPRPVGSSNNPIGAGLAACLGAAQVFRDVFLDDAEPQGEVVFSGLELEPQAAQDSPPSVELEIPPSTALVGLGAIGNGALWTLARSPLHGELVVVDPEPIELSNLQRYAMSERGDVGRAKVEIGAECLKDISVNTQKTTWAKFTAANGHKWDRVMVALDSAADRRAVQDSLPRWIVNGWTQPGDLGVSVHPWNVGACLSCLYLPAGEVASEDEQVAAALGLPGRRPKVRRLLVGNEPTPKELLAEAADALEIDPEPLLAFAGRPLREIYVEGICGGAAVPLDRIGQLNGDVHVPLPHQSTMAGILLVARLLRELSGLENGRGAEATRIDLMRPLGARLTSPVAKDGRGICICQDPVYQAAYDEKWDNEGSQSDPGSLDS